MTRYLRVDVSHHEELDVFEHLLRDFQLLLVVRQHGPGQQQRALPPCPLFPALTVQNPPGPGSLPSPSPRRAAEPREQGARCGTHHPPPGRRGGGRGRGEPPPQSGSPRPISHHGCRRAAPASDPQALSLLLPLSPNRTGRQHPGPELPPRGMQWTSPERQRRAAGIPGPAHWRGEGRQPPLAPPPGRLSPAPKFPPLGPAVRGRGRWRRGPSAASARQWLDLSHQPTHV